MQRYSITYTVRQFSSDIRVGLTAERKAYFIFREFYVR